MANTIVLTDSVISISDIDSDWNWYDTLAAFATSKVGVKIQSIHFKPGATDDECIISNETIDGAPIFNAKCADVYDDKTRYYDGKELKPVLDFSDGSYSAGSSVQIILGD